MRKKILAFVLTLAMVLGLVVTASASEAGNATQFGVMPAGTYTYVAETPVGSEDAGQWQFDYFDDTVYWAYGSKTGSIKLTGDELKLMQSLYLSDRPVTDWLGGSTKDTEGYLGDVSGNVHFTIDEDGKLSYINTTKPATRVTVVLSADITANSLTIRGVARGRPNLLQPCITLLGSCNGLHLTYQGDVIMDNLVIGHDENGLGLSADKIGGDTFVNGTVTVDGRINWYSKKGIITAFSGKKAVLETNGYDIHMPGGSNIGRVGRSLTISTGIDKPGDIIIGDEVYCDATRGGLLPNADTSTDSLAIATSGDLIAGLGDVIIGTNTEKAVLIDIIGNIQGNNVTILPNDWGKPGKISMQIGNITATTDINIVVGDVNPGEERVNISQSSEGGILTTGNTSVEVELNDIPIGDLTAINGDINLVTGKIIGGLGRVTAPNGSIVMEIGK